MTESHPPQDLTGSWTHKRVQYWDAGADTLYLDTWPEYSGEVDEIAINPRMSRLRHHNRPRSAGTLSKKHVDAWTVSRNGDETASPRRRRRSHSSRMTQSVSPQQRPWGGVLGDEEVGNSMLVDDADEADEPSEYDAARRAILDLRSRNMLNVQSHLTLAVQHCGHTRESFSLRGSHDAYERKVKALRDSIPSWGNKSYTFPNFIACNLKHSKGRIGSFEVGPGKVASMNPTTVE